MAAIGNNCVVFLYQDAMFDVIDNPEFQIALMVALMTLNGQGCNFLITWYFVYLNTFFFEYTMLVLVIYLINC